MTKSTITTWVPTAEIVGPIVPSNRYGEGLDTALHARLERAANKLLAACGFFDQPDAEPTEYFEDLYGEVEYIPLEADACSTFGLRPTWHGRA